MRVNPGRRDGPIMTPPGNGTKVFHARCRHVYGRLSDGGGKREPTAVVDSLHARAESASP